MKRIVDIPDEVLESKHYCQYFGAWSTKLTELIEQSKPYDDSGDLISRKDLQAKHDESCAGECACCAYGVDYTKSSDSKFHCLLIDNAQAVDLWQMRQEATENALKKAEVLYGRPQGEWKTAVHGLRAYHVCNKCNTEYPFDLTQDWILCPVCGTEMKGGAE